MIYNFLNYVITVYTSKAADLMSYSEVIGILCLCHYYNLTFSSLPSLFPSTNLPQRNAFQKHLTVEMSIGSSYHFPFGTPLAHFPPTYSTTKYHFNLPFGRPLPFPFIITTNSPDVSMCPITSGSFETGIFGDFSIIASLFSWSLSSPSITPSSLNILSSSFPC